MDARLAASAGLGALALLMSSCAVGTPPADEELSPIDSPLLIPPDSPECEEVVFYRGDDWAEFYPWYDYETGEAGVDWAGSAAPAGWIEGRSLSFSNFLPGIGAKPAFAVFEHTHWFPIVAGGDPIELYPGDDYGEFAFEIWGEDHRCHVRGAAGPAFVSLDPSP